MKVKVGNTIYDDEETPITLILNDRDKKNISEMKTEENCYLGFSHYRAFFAAQQFLNVVADMEKGRKEQLNPNTFKVRIDGTRVTIEGKKEQNKKDFDFLHNVLTHGYKGALDIRRSKLRSKGFMPWFLVEQKLKSTTPENFVSDLTQDISGSGETPKTDQSQPQPFKVKDRKQLLFKYREQYLDAIQNCIAAPKFTVRRGTKWMEQEGKNVDVVHKGNDFTNQCQGEITKCILMRFEDIPSRLVEIGHFRNNNDLSSLKMDKPKLLKTLKEMYEGFSQKEIVTLVYFKVK